MVNKKNKRKIGRPAKYDWEALKPIMLALAKVAYETPRRLGRVLDIPESSIRRFLARDRDFARLLKIERAKFTNTLIERMNKSSRAGSDFATKYLLDRNIEKYDRDIEKMEENSDGGTKIFVKFVRKDDK